MAKGYIVTTEIFVSETEAGDFAWAYGGGKKDGAKQSVHELLGVADPEGYEVKNVRKVK